MGYFLHTGWRLADGTQAAAQRLHRVFTNDPGIGVARHAGAGDEVARQTALHKGIHIPMNPSDGPEVSPSNAACRRFFRLKTPSSPRILRNDLA
jgi:hypothetical protein